MSVAVIKGFEFVDLVVFAALTAVLGIMIWLHYRKNGAVLRSISATVAAEKRTSLVFSVVMSVLYPLYYAWLWLWVGPKVGAPPAYYVILAVAAVFELVFVWVPSTTGWRHETHKFAATMVGFGMLILPGMFLMTAQAMSVAAMISIAVFYAVALSVSTLLVLPRYRGHTFIYEVLYCAAFLVAASIVGHS